VVPVTLNGYHFFIQIPFSAPMQHRKGMTVSDQHARER
jgi:hypothetical protein